MLLGEQGSERASDRSLIVELLVPHRDRLNALFDQAPGGIDDSLKARQLFVVAGGRVNVGPDYYAQLEAVNVFTLLMHKASKGEPIVHVPAVSD